jgi:aminoglycoside phosphotransferase (APT) family kinase protein
VVHVDEARRAVLSTLVVDRSWPAQFGNPATRGAAIDALGRMLAQRAHLPTPPGMGRAEVRPVLQAMWNALSSDATLPRFVHEVVDALLAEPPVAQGGPLVMSHNDVNPSNLVFDGTRVLLLDWDTAAPNDPLYDLATVAMFFRMDEGTCQQLVGAHDDAPTVERPRRSHYCTLCRRTSGVAAMSAARARGHVGIEIPADDTPTLGEIYQELRAGTIDIQGVAGQWTFGLALVKEAAGLPR